MNDETSKNIKINEIIYYFELNHLNNDIYNTNYINELKIIINKFLLTKYYQNNSLIISSILIQDILYKSIKIKSIENHKEILRFMIVNIDKILNNITVIYYQYLHDLFT
jgi:hypothetical protein